MKSKLLRYTDEHGLRYRSLAFICPGCAEIGGSGLHILPVNTKVTYPAWTWNGDLEFPTLSPSILTAGAEDPITSTRRCHSFLRNGVVEYLPDCAHSMAGKHVPLPDLPDWITNEGKPQ